MAKTDESIIYLDHNATTPLVPNVLDRMHKVYAKDYGNPSSPHQLGRRARDLLEDARERLAALLDTEPRELIFTSGGSEGNNAVLRQLLFQKKQTHLVVSAIEHPSILETARCLTQKKNLKLTVLPVDRGGRVSMENLKSIIRPETRLVSLMAANNETGVLQPIQEIASFCYDHGVSVHSDCVQFAGKKELKLGQYGLDYATLTAHKIGGPKGVGLLYVRGGADLHPLISGGGQERRWRAGTESIALACGYAEAMKWFVEHRQSLEKNWQVCTGFFLQQLNELDQFFLFAEPEDSLPNTLNLGFRGLNTESLLISLDLEGFAVSSGSACSSGAMEASHVLLAMGYSHEEAKSSLRVSMGWNTTIKDMEKFSARLFYHVRRLAKHPKRTDNSARIPAGEAVVGD